MYSIRKQFNSFWNMSNYYLEYLKIDSSDNRKVYVYSSGVLNNIWQSWSRFWRTFWLAHILGGIDIKNKKIYPYSLFTGRDEKEAIHYLLHILGKKKKPIGKIKGSYQEPNWGDSDIIEKLSIEIFGINNNIINAFSILGTTLKHLQIVRNASIHLDRDNMNKIKSDIVPYYIITKIKYPTDIIYSRNLAGKKVITNWVDELITFLQLI